MALLGPGALLDVRSAKGSKAGVDLHTRSKLAQAG